jgi:hypothetical protein
MMNNNKMYRITTNNKLFNQWAKETKKKLAKEPEALQQFSQGYNEVVNGQYLARATFVAYWSIHSNHSLARLAPAITQASLIHLLHRFAEQNKAQEVETVGMMIQNFLRLLQNLENVSEEE